MTGAACRQRYENIVDGESMDGEGVVDGDPEATRP